MVIHHSVCKLAESTIAWNGPEISEISTVQEVLMETKSFSWLHKNCNNRKNAEVRIFYPTAKMLNHEDETYKKNAVYIREMTNETKEGKRDRLEDGK